MGIIILSLPLPMLLALPLVYLLPTKVIPVDIFTLPSRRCCVCVPFLPFILFLQLNIVALLSDQLAWLLTFFFHIFLVRNFYYSSLTV